MKKRGISLIIGGLIVVVYSVLYKQQIRQNTSFISSFNIYKLTDEEYVYEFIFYSKGLKNSDIKTMYHNVEVSAKWEEADEKRQQESYQLDELINFVQ